MGDEERSFIDGGEDEMGEFPAGLSPDGALVRRRLERGLDDGDAVVTFEFPPGVPAEHGGTVDEDDALDLGFERGVATLGQQVGFERELLAIAAAATASGRGSDPDVRERLGEAFIGLKVLRYMAFQTMGADAGVTAASVSKLLWASWHQRLGELAMDLAGASATLTDGAPYELTAAQRLFLFTRADTIYGGSHEIQRNIVAERMLGLPRA